MLFFLLMYRPNLYYQKRKEIEVEEITDTAYNKLPKGRHIYTYTMSMRTHPPPRKRIVHTNPVCLNCHNSVTVGRRQQDKTKPDDAGHAQ